MSRFGLLVLLCASCVQSGEVVCSDGRICAPGYACDDENHRCLSADQIAACAGRPDGADCSFAGAPGSCRKGACEPLVCGDGLRSFGEACDGADLGTAAGGNVSDCTDAGFYNPEGLACSSFCTFDVSGCTGFCGDNVINGSELCDGAPPQGACFELGFDAGPLACASSCGFSFASCGRFGWAPEGTGMPVAYAMHGTSATDVWVVGEDNVGSGVIAHYDGSTWSRTATGSSDKLLAVWAVAPGDAWIASVPAGSGAGRPRHFANGQWTVVADAPAADYTTVWAAAADAVYFGTKDMGVVWWNGQAWQTLGGSTGNIAALRGTSTTDIWAVRNGTLSHWDGAQWSPATPGITVTDIDARAPNDVWAIGGSGGFAAAAHFNGMAWTSYAEPSISAAQGFTSLSAGAANDLWVGGPFGVALHFDGTRWTSSLSAVVVNSTFGGFIDMQRFGDVVMGMTFDGFVYRYRGQMFARTTVTGGTFASRAMWTNHAADAFVGDARGNVYRFNGATWAKYALDTTASPQGFAALWGTGPTNVWASGSQGRTFRWNGSMWTDMQAGVGIVNAIWGTGPSDVWLFGSSAVHYDGMTFTPTTTGGTTFFAASGSGPSDVWALAQAVQSSTTEVHRWNGSAWSMQTMPHDMTSIAVVAPNNVFITADTNHILHYDGATWSDTVVPVIDELVGIVATAPDDVFAITRSEVVHFDGTTWSRLRLPAETSTSVGTVTAVSATPGVIDFVYTSMFGAQPVRRLVRTQRWACRASETACSDGVDDDCDNLADAFDSDCP